MSLISAYARLFAVCGLMNCQLSKSKEQKLRYSLSSDAVAGSDGKGLEHLQLILREALVAKVPLGDEALWVLPVVGAAVDGVLRDVYDGLVFGLLVCFSY